MIPSRSRPLLVAFCAMILSFAADASGASYLLPIDARAEDPDGPNGIFTRSLLAALGEYAFAVGYVQTPADPRYKDWVETVRPAVKGAVETRVAALVGRTGALRGLPERSPRGNSLFDWYIRSGSAALQPLLLEGRGEGGAPGARRVVEGGERRFYGDHGVDYQRARACCWIEGTLRDLVLPDGAVYSRCFRPVVAGGATYVPGQYWAEGGKPSPCCWVNGELVEVPIPGDYASLSFRLVDPEL